MRVISHNLEDICNSENQPLINNSPTS